MPALKRRCPQRFVELTRVCDVFCSSDTFDFRHTSDISLRVFEHVLTHIVIKASPNSTDNWAIWRIRVFKSTRMSTIIAFGFIKNISYIWKAKRLFPLRFCSPMTTYIAHFTAGHRLIQIRQNSIFTWQQESGEVDTGLLADKIRRESSLPFYRLLAGPHIPVSLEDITVEVHKAQPFPG